MRSLKSAGGFSLVELLVVVAIVAFLVALLLPAVQASREAVRQTQCVNNLKQIASACLISESVTAHMPTGGWGTPFLGDPERGAGFKQPGGAIYNILPFLEAGNLHDVLAHRTSGSVPTLIDAAREMIATPIAGFLCPSRRPAQAFLQQPMGMIDTGGILIYDLLFLARGAVVENLTYVARTDYCGNGYDYVGLEEVVSLTGYYANPSLYALIGPDFAAVKGDATPRGVSPAGTGSAGVDATIFAVPAKEKALISAINASIAGRGGVFFPLSTVRIGQITDGTSLTYLFGEKYLNPDKYYDGLSHGDCFCCYVGAGPDTLRYSAVDSHYGLMHYGAAYRDTCGFNTNAHWGGPHVGGFNMAFCDGSVHTVSFAISPIVHGHLGNRDDGAVIDPTGFGME